MGAVKVENIPHYTYADYKEWEGNWELINGIPYAMSPAPMIKHQKISNNIAWLLKNSLEECTECHALLPVDWKISDDTIVQPDNLVVCYEPSGAYITKAPTMIFEVLSPKTAKKDTTVKFDIYEKEGVKYYIIVNPDDHVAKVYRLHEGKYIKTTDATDEKLTFDLEKCTIEINFAKLWK